MLFVVRYVVPELLPGVLRGSLSESSEPAHFRREGTSWGARCFPDNARYIVFFIFLVMDELKSAHLFRLADFILVSFLAMSFFI